MDSANHGENNDWRVEQAKLLLETGLFSDIQIVVEYPNEPVQVLRLHKTLLYLSSPVWATAVKWATKDEIKITGHPFSVIFSLIKCIYKETMQIESINHCIGIMKAADFYNMDKPIEFCNKYIQNWLKSSEINLKVFVELLNVCELIKFKTSRAFCFAYVEDNPRKFFLSEEFLQSSSEVILTLARIQNYICEEDFLIRSLLRWCETNRGDSSLKKFTDDIGIVELFRWQLLKIEEKHKLLNDYPDLFQGEKYDLIYDSTLAANEMRGEPNVIECLRVIVNGPPCVIVEQFTYFGQPTVLPIVSIQIALRTSVIDYTITNVYEDIFSIHLFDRTIEFDGPVLDSKGPIVNIPPPLLRVPLQNEQQFSVVITLKKTGVYYKNANFGEFGQGLYRFTKGIIENINSSPEEPSHM